MPVNRSTRLTPDAAGAFAPHLQLAAEGEAARFATLPALPLVRAARQAGVAMLRELAGHL